MGLILGKKITDYPDIYTPSSVEILQPIPRQIQRAHLPMCFELGLPFKGVDWWSHYEFSWLDAESGWPVHGFLHISIPASSSHIIESKSLKIYLGVFANSLMTQEKVLQTIERDLSLKAQAPIHVRFEPFSCAQFSELLIPDRTQYFDLGALNVSCDSYDYDPLLLKKQHLTEKEERKFYFTAFRSNCLVTGQPDWAHIFITFTADEQSICPESLLKYLVSFRQHQEFHEHCIERIYCDLYQTFLPLKLTVYGAFFRRGSLDINPIRSSEKIEQSWSRLAYH